MSEAPHPPFVIEDESPPRGDAAGDSDTLLNDNQQQHHPQRSTAAVDRRASNMETLLRQWEAEGVAASRNNSSSRLLFDTDNNAGGDDIMNNMYSLRIDRSASLDDELIAAHNFATSMNSNNNTHNNAATERVERSDSIGSINGNHRRVSSAGGSRSLPFELAQLYDEMPLLDAAALHDAARITDWPTVLSLSTSHPDSAKYVGKDGWNALHHACDRRCPHVDVMESLLTAYPDALVQTNDKGWTPLHRACRNKTPKDVVRLLLCKYSTLGKRAAMMRCNDGRSSLHYALLYDAPEGVVELLLQADPGAVLDEDRDGVTPLGTVWDKYANSFEGKRMLQILKPFEGEGWGDGGGGGGNNNANNNDSSEEAELVERMAKKAAETRVRNVMENNDQPSFRQLQWSWKTANILLRAYFRFPLQEEEIMDDDTSTPRRKWRVFHATCAIKCHPKLILMARALHPEQAMEVDENDLFRDASHDIANPDLQSRQFPVSRTALHFAAMSSLSGKEGRNVIKLVLKLNPNAARHVDGHGNLPLHLICQNSHKMQWISDGPKDILEAYPEASVIGDSNGKTPLHCIASSFWCVRSRPSRHATLPPSARTVRPGGIPPNFPPLPNESVIQNLVEANAIAASIADDSGRLPLHYIAIHAEEWTADITSILTAHPAAAQTRAGPSTHSQLPLHMVAFSPFARPSLIKNLVIANPRASSIMDDRGQLPLHLAVDSGRIMWDEGIQAIYEAYTPAISTPEESPRHWTVLHVAAASASAGRELIEYIIAQHENSVSIPDGDGKYPLHLACATSKSWVEGGIKSIFDANPSVGLFEDLNHLLPFHIAALTGCMSTNTTLSADRDSCIIDTLDGMTNSVAARGDTFNDDLKSLEVLFNLLTAQPSIVNL
jgi:ankyrin repeat protein